MPMSAFDEFVERYHLALDEFSRGNTKPAQALYSHREDATLANPFGPVAKGWLQIEETMERAAANFREADAGSYETVARYETPELAYLVEVERFRAKVGGGHEFATGAVRVTSILRPEDGIWKIVHRHADPITTPRPAESVVQHPSYSRVLKPQAGSAER
jgi:ketosteroid isomerase-like protein